MREFAVSPTQPFQAIEGADGTGAEEDKENSGHAPTAGNNRPRSLATFGEAGPASVESCRGAGHVLGAAVHHVARRAMGDNGQAVLLDAILGLKEGLIGTMEKRDVGLRQDMEKRDAMVEQISDQLGRTID